MQLTVRRLDPTLTEDFLGLTAGEACGGCHCVAWWVPTWEGWGERAPAENRALREELFSRGEFDGYLAHTAGGEPVGWCQVGPRDRLEKLVSQLALAPDPGTWAITCFRVPAEYRRRGVARRLLDGVLADLPGRGARRVEAYPRHDASADALELWNGPAALFERAGFREVGRDARRAVLALEL